VGDARVLVRVRALGALCSPRSGSTFSSIFVMTVLLLELLLLAGEQQFPNKSMRRPLGLPTGLGRDVVGAARVFRFTTHFWDQNHFASLRELQS
jgi:hypothetical protein